MCVISLSVVRVRVVFVGDDPIPLHYRYAVQSMVYRVVSPEMSRFLHQEGFRADGRRFKLFCFSDILGGVRWDRARGVGYPVGEMSLYVSSPIKTFIDEFVTGLTRNRFLRIGGSSYRVVSIHVENREWSGDEGDTVEYRVRMLSPVTVYSTLQTPDGRRKTYYYNPVEREFTELINTNARRKYSILHGDPGEMYLEITPLRRPKEVVTYYKGTVIKGWKGLYRLRGSLGLIRIVYEAGLGSKNPQGFGLFKILDG